METPVPNLGSLFDRCRRKFVDAARLVGADLSQWPNLMVVGRETPVDLTELVPVWSELCHRYIAEKSTNQFNLFSETMSARDAFSQHIYWNLWPTLEKEAGVVRSVLRATGALPTKNKAEAGNFLVQYMRDMDMTARMQPFA